ncbi:helix-turn-helix domain-containing protein [Streptococcus mutans]|uniref:helix-turn-helix domain-containing protein n=1 Tax=Streptococcus mutans TaxID=1309 RepID=UPI0004676254|nr:helix-turn-helix domain-containing protein [Streptococcus mutans]MCB5024486.1 helix-turn-helix domain-containing protein [Streptococcus mutans]
MLEAILETLQEYSLKEVSDKEEKVFKQVQKYLAKHDFIRVKELQELAALSPASARRYLTKFTQLGLLDSKGSNRDRRYQSKENS